MPHALGEFIRQQMDERGWRNRDLEQRSGFSRAQSSRLVNDRRDVLTRLPNRETLEGLARAFGTNVEFVLGKAVESLGLGFTSADFVNEVQNASDEELLSELRNRLAGTAESRETPPVAPAMAARTGASRGGKLRSVQDQDATRPDPEGPEHGA